MQRLVWAAALLAVLVGLAHVQQVAAQRVAVIGAGMGGASAAHYLRKWRPQSNVTVYERNDYIGGRLKHIVLDGVTVEVGGDAWSIVNPYMVQLAAEFNIQFDNTSYSGNGRAEIWDGRKLYPTSSDWIDEAELLVLMEWLRGNLWLNYLERGTGGVESKAFRSISEFTRYGSLDRTYLYDYLHQDLIKKYAIDKDLVWHNWTPISRVIYDQDMRINSFAGMVVLLSAFTDSYSVAGGNSLLVEKLLAKANAQVHLNTQVTSITRLGNRYSVATVPAQDMANPHAVQEEIFDEVVLAAPIEFASIRFVTYVVAKAINPSYFNLSPSAEAPSFVLTSENSTAPFNSIATEAKGADGNVIFKIFGNVNLTESVLNRVFVKMVTYHVQHWPYTFPDLSPVQDQRDYQPIILDESSTGSVLYLNAIENVATAMEASVIAGRNAALLMAHRRGS